MTIDVIIPVYKPGRQLFKLLDCLRKQTVRPEKIILVITEKQSGDLLSEDVLREQYGVTTVFHVLEREFDHGGSRNLGVSGSRSDSFLMMTQDAMPSDFFLIEKLIKALEDKKTAVAYARQCPRPDSDELERFIRGFNYGTEPLYKTIRDVERMGIKAYFCSNVCAAYNRQTFIELGRFISKTVFNEDMIFAAEALKAGYAVQYVPEAAVYHAHHYTIRQQFRRNFDIGVSHADHPEVFGGLSSESEGLLMIRQAVKYLIKRRKPHLIFRLFLQSLSKYRGYRLGRNYQRLSIKRIRKYSMNKHYWD